MKANKPLSAVTHVVDGVTFRPYWNGIGSSIWKDDATMAIRVGRNYQRTTFFATIGQAGAPGYVRAGDAFRSFETAARAAIKLATKVRS